MIFNFYDKLLPSTSVHQGNKPLGFNVFHLFTISPTCFVLNWGCFQIAGIFYNQKIPESSFITLGVRDCDGTHSLNPTSVLMQLWHMIDKAYLQNCKIVTYLNSVAKYVSATKTFDLTFLALPHENKHLLFVVFFLLGDSQASEFYVEQTQCSKMSAHNIHMPGNHPKERIQHSEHGGSLKSRICDLVT